MKISQINKTVLFFLLVVLFASSYKNIIAQDYTLVWSDEFDETSLDLSKWECQIGNGSGGWGNNEKQYYRSENAVVDSGYLTIIAKKENYNNFGYTSARIRTIKKGDWKYGKFEMRAKLPFGKGIWPAYWMMPTDNVYGGWAASGEIDIMEYLGHQTNKVYGTIHYGGAWPNNTSSGGSYSLSSGSFSEDFHTFLFVWEENKMQWFVDGVLYSTKTSWSTKGYSYPAPFDQRFHYILNLAVGGNWPGYPDSTTTFPQKYVIDYVRVYQKTETAVQEENKLPEEYSLQQNYPNPFNAETIIEYEIAKAGRVNLSVFDMLGRTVNVLVNKNQERGKYSVHFNASNLSSGVYMYCLNAGGTQINRKLILIK